MTLTQKVNSYKLLITLTVTGMLILNPFFIIPDIIFPVVIKIEQQIS